MNKIKTLFILLTIALPVVVSAQQPLKLYDEMSDALQSVFCDYVTAEAEIRYMSGTYGQYLGQLIDNTIYGWGYFLSNDGSQTFGQYRRGKHLFGITLTSKTALVGSDTHFVEYDLETGTILRTHDYEGDHFPGEDYMNAIAEGRPYNGFYRITYSNGDAYYGETYNGRRHGYGIYYWKNGDFWYGEYRNGYRQGYGALFKADRHISYGKWIGDRKVEDD